MATKHSENHVGLQNHSIGEEYPWTIAMVGNYWQPRQLVSGEKGPLFSSYGLTNKGISPYQRAEAWVADRTSKLASESTHTDRRGKYLEGMDDLADLAYSPSSALCVDTPESLAFAALLDFDENENGSLLAGQYAWPDENEDSTLVEYSFLLPSCNNSGETYHTAQWQSLETKLVDLFGGYTRQAGFSGAWVDDSGKTLSDTLVRYSVACELADYPALRTLVSQACIDWGQACIYVVRSSESVELVR